MSSKTINALFIASGFALATLSASANATLINAGFEDANLNGWTVNGSASVVNSHDGDWWTTYHPQQGNYFLSLQAGAANVWQTVTQTFNLNTGDTLAGFAAFDYGDYFPYIDGARVRILGSTGGEVDQLFHQVGDWFAPYGDYPWASWEWSALTAGTYTLEFSVRNTLDSDGDSYGLFDVSLNAANAPAQVPEPGILALLGFAALGGFVARQKKKA